MGQTRSSSAAGLADLAAHAPLLYHVALTITGDADLAREATVVGLARARVGQVPRDGACRTDQRRTLAACVHAAAADLCDDRVDERADDLAPTERLLAGVERTVRRQREVLALCLYGAHDVPQAARALWLSCAEVSALLGSALVDLGSPVAEEWEVSRAG